MLDVEGILFWVVDFVWVWVDDKIVVGLVCFVVWFEFSLVVGGGVIWLVLEVLVGWVILSLLCIMWWLVWCDLDLIVVVLSFWWRVIFWGGGMGM